MSFTLWYILVGLLLVTLAMASSVLRPLPVTMTMFYLVVGMCLGPLLWGAFQLDPIADAEFLEHFTEVAVIVSLFSAGLKLRTPLREDRWKAPLRLAFVSMTISVGLVTWVGVQWLGLPLGAAVLLGAVLAPTDPVLASDVQLSNPRDRDRLRFSLTGEAGMNDGTAFPFVMLGLGLLGLHPIGELGWRWWLVDVLWAIPGGLAIGTLLGTLIARLVLYVRRRYQEAVGLDDFLALGLIAISYGAAVALHTYGFLSVFAAGLAVRRVERKASGPEMPKEVKEHPGYDEELATDPERAPAYMAQAALGFSEQLERILEVTVVVFLGTMLTWDHLAREALWFVPLLFLVIRPASVVMGLSGLRVGPVHTALISWFGIRGLGSLYYLMYAIGQGASVEVSQRLVSLTLAAVAASIVLHGISVTPLMRQYEQRGRGKEQLMASNS